MKDLNIEEIKNTSGGNIFHDAGKAAHEAWNSVQEWWCSVDLTTDYVNSPIHGPNGNHYM